MKRMKWWMVLLVAAAMVGAASGKEITLKQAETAVGNWVARGGAFGKLASNEEVSGETFEDPDTGAKMHVVRVPGNGFVVTSADDGIEPVVMFSDGDGEFVAEEGNPLWDLLRWDLAAREKALEEGDGTGNAGSVRKGSTSESDGVTAQEKWEELLAPQRRGNGYYGLFREGLRIRRYPLLKTHWDQRGGPRVAIYNLYTPETIDVVTVQVAKAAAKVRAPEGWVADALVTNQVGHYPVGCVAVAGGQVMNFWQYPTSAVPAMTVTCQVDGVSCPLTFYGTFVGNSGYRFPTYEWESMGLSEPILPLESERVSRLLSDIGVACAASYAATGTSMSVARLASELKATFGYASAVYHTANLSGNGLQQVLIPNLDAGAPVVLGIGHAHAVVADGYAFNADESTFYVHINLGWGQASHLWYVPPDIERYSTIDEILCNVFPDFTGVVVSGRVIGRNKRPVYKMNMVRTGTTAGVTETGAGGIYRFLLGAGSYQVTPVAMDGTVAGDAQSVTTTAMGLTVNGNRILDFQATNVNTVGDIAVGTVSPSGARGTFTTFSEPFAVSLSSPTAGAEIHYTFDDRIPGADDPVYDGPITIYDTTTLRAVAFAAGMECSEMLEETYTFNDPQSRDNFADARVILGTSGQSSFNNEGYTKEEGEPTHSDRNYPGGASAWARWTAPETGDWTFWLEGTNGSSEVNTQLAVYTGEAVGSLTRIAANDYIPAGGRSSRLSFSATKGVEYMIAMDTYAGRPGILKLRWEEGHVDYVHFKLENSATASVPQSGRFEVIVESSTNWGVVEWSASVHVETMSGQNGDMFACSLPANETGTVLTGEYVTLQAGNSERVTLYFRQHFIDFVTTREAAIERAWRENKRILLLYGADWCPYTYYTLYSSIPAVKALLDAGYVLWYCNADFRKDARMYISSGWVPQLGVIDPLDISKAVAWRDGEQSASELQSLLESSSWQGLPRVQFELNGIAAESATVMTKVAAWGAGASSATVTLETASDATFTGVVSTRELGTITQLWTEQAWTFGAPTATEVAFCRVRVTSGDWTEVSDVVEFIPLAIALDNDTMTFSNEGDTPWLGQTAVSHDGVDAAMCVSTNATGTNQFVESQFKTTVQGPGQLSFWWKGDGNWGWLNLYVDGEKEKYISVNKRVWEEVRWDFPDTSEHEVAWVLERENYDDEDFNVTGWVDQVTWTPDEIVPLATALDNDALTFITEGDVPWMGQTVVSHDGEDAARCANPPIADTEARYSWLKTTVQGPGRLSFWWKADGHYGSLAFVTDDRVRKSISATNRIWTEGSWDFADANQHEVAWRVSRSYAYYSVTGWVDQVTWTPGNIVTLDRQNGNSSQPKVLGIVGEAMPAVDVPTRTGYTFGGYYSGVNGTGTRYYTETGASARTWDGTGDATLYAKWTPNTYTVTLDRQGGAGGAASVVATYGAFTPSVTVPTREGCDFGGYFTGESGTGVRFINAAGGGVTAWNIASNTVLYAHWLEKADVEWEYYILGGKAIVTNAVPARGRLEIPTTLGGYPVGGIGYGAFYGATNLTGVVIPSSVTSIKAYAFYGCDGLASVVIPEGVQVIESGAFEYCSALTEVVLPESLTEIGTVAFYGCTGLATIRIPAGVIWIGVNALGGCSHLAAIEVASGNAVYASEGGVLFSKDKSRLLVAPSGLAGAYAVPDGVKNIGSDAFNDCVELMSVALPDGLMNIGDDAFNHCTGLTSVEIPNGVTNIGASAFYYASRLQSMVIPDSVVSIGERAFQACSRLSRLEVPGAWWGTDNVVKSGVPSGCEVVYRGISPLAVITEDLPAGTEGMVYQAVLAATGGVAPYVWSEGVAPHSERSAASSYAATGTAKGWQGDDGCWDLALPFAFPFFGGSYTNAKVNSNGAISFGTEYFRASRYLEDVFGASPIVAVMWADLDTRGGDIYVESGADAVTVRWAGTYYASSGDGGAVNFSVTLHKDGRIVLSYGEGNASGGAIGLSAGDGRTVVFSEKSGNVSLENAEDVVFTPGAGLPSWLALSADGTLSGMPPTAGEWTVPVMVTDAKGMCARQNLTLAVAGSGPGTETTPVSVPHAWLAGYGLGDGTVEGYEAAANAKAANEMKVWECYWVGLDPVDEGASFKVKSISFEDGVPKLEWDPDLSDAGARQRKYVVWGRKSIEKAEEGEGATDGWVNVTGQEATWVTNGWRFFRVDVEMPE